MARLLTLVGALIYGTGASCLKPDVPEDAGVVLRESPNYGLNCGDPTSPGNEVGIGKFCRSTSECPVTDVGTTIQCSGTLTDEKMPFMCSRLCGGGDDLVINCGTGATCRDLAHLGYDLMACVPDECEELFVQLDAGVGGPDGGAGDGGAGDGGAGDGGAGDGGQPDGGAGDGGAGDGGVGATDGGG